MIKVKPESTTSEEAELIELYDASGFEQYCISSIICDKEGTLYYKNDSGNVFAVGVPDYKTVVNLIRKIGIVTLDSEIAIKTAKEAYESLSMIDKELVSNYNVLERALFKLEELKDLKEKEEKKKEQEKQDDIVNINNKEELKDNILDIKDKEKNGESILVKAPIPNKEMLVLNNEEKEEEVKEEVSEDPVMVVVQKINDILNPADQSKALPNDKKEINETQLNDIIEVYRMYEILADEDKPKVENYVEFEQLLEEVGEAMHYDKESNIMVENLDWYYKLEVAEQEFSDSEKEEIQKVLGNDAAILLSYNISIKNVLTGKEEDLDKSVTVKIPVPNMESNNEFVIVHINDNGKYEYIKCSVKDGYIIFDTQEFSSYRVVESKQNWADIMNEDKPVEGNLYIWIIICTVAVVILGALFIYKRKHNFEVDNK